MRGEAIKSAKHQTKLRELRKRMGRTQAEVARDLGLNEKTYSGYETGRTEMGAETLKLFARYFSCSVDEILGLKRIHHPHDALLGIEREAVVIDLFRDLAPHHQESVLDIMHGCARRNFIDRL